MASGTEIALRRPLAAAFRSVLLVFGNFSLSAHADFAGLSGGSRGLFRRLCGRTWRGIWAGIAFFALTYIYDALLCADHLSPNRWDCSGRCCRSPSSSKRSVARSVRPALVAFAMTTVALMTRMGSMFTIPALLVWLVWQFGQGVSGKTQDIRRGYLHFTWRYRTEFSDCKARMEQAQVQRPAIFLTRFADCRWERHGTVASRSSPRKARLLKVAKMPARTAIFHGLEEFPCGPQSPFSGDCRVAPTNSSRDFPR